MLEPSQLAAHVVRLVLLELWLVGGAGMSEQRVPDGREIDHACEFAGPDDVCFICGAERPPDRPCNICGEPWPHHAEACAYLGNVRDGQRYKAAAANWEAVARELYEVTKLLLSRGDFMPEAELVRAANALVAFDEASKESEQREEPKPPYEQLESMVRGNAEAVMRYRSLLSESQAEVERWKELALTNAAEIEAWRTRKPLETERELAESQARERQLVEIGSRLLSAYEQEESEDGFPFSFELRDAHRALREALSSETERKR